ncbi:MAG: class I SAM-dependent methyltransferase [Kiritimatiellae bacterium]|nr:class I SAM-dependent methyltransferase [Kiritimatiellia bacterium]
MTNDLYSSGEYLRRNPGWHVEDSSWKANHILNVLNRNNLKPDSICEVGCGAGDILVHLSRNLPNATLHGYDISADAHEKCRGKESDRLHFHEEDILEQENGIHDVVLVIDVIEHVEDYFTFLRRLRKKGRHFVFHIPLEINVHSVLRRWLMNAQEAVGHIHYFTKETAIATLANTGYNVRDSFYTCGAIDIPDEATRRSRLKLLRKMMFRLNKDIAARLLTGFSLMVLAE